MNDGTNDLFGVEPTPADEKPSGKKPRRKTNEYDPPNLGKAIRLPVSDFSDPDRPPVCLEVDFPIAPINALSNLEGNAGKPIYQMSKWWARRRSSVFRSLLIAAATRLTCVRRSSRRTSLNRSSVAEASSATRSSWACDRYPSR